MFLYRRSKGPRKQNAALAERKANEYTLPSRRQILPSTLPSSLRGRLLKGPTGLGEEPTEARSGAVLGRRAGAGLAGLGWYQDGGGPGVGPGGAWCEVRAGVANLVTHSL